MTGIGRQQRQEILTAILDIYGSSEIETAFIAGSVAAGKSRPDSDIDVFFAHSSSIEHSTDKKQEFTDFYFDIHQRLGREPDYISPGEVLDISELHTAIWGIQLVAPASVLLRRKDFDAICWAGMLVGKRDELLPSSDRIKTLRSLSRSIVVSWAGQLVPDKQVSIETGEYSDADKILRMTVSCPGYYDAH